MKRNYLLKNAVSVALLAAATQFSYAQQKPSAPVNLNAEGDYDEIVLTWQRFAQGETLLTEGFENEIFPPQGWNKQTLNTIDVYTSWFSFPTEELEEELGEFYLMNVHSGEKSAGIFFDPEAPHEDGSPSTQDEWLITPTVAGAQYINFYHMIDPMILEYGQYEEFGDHYTVEVSYDGGETWTVLWDARYDSNDTELWQPVSLYLGDTSQGTPMVAFHAQSNVEDPDESLYFTWFIDDVSFSNDPEASEMTMPAKTKSIKPTGALQYKKFDTTGLTPQKRERRVLKAAPQESFNIYLDGESVAEGVRALTYTDNTPKTPGQHTYAVRSCSPEGVESDATEVVVTTKAPAFNAPQNVRATGVYNSERDGYDITVTWDAPEGEREPAYYNAYCNGVQFGSELELGEVGQAGLFKGVYNYSITAVYLSPDGESEPVSDMVAVGTRNPVENLQATLDDNDCLTMTWNAPKESEYGVKNYRIFRGNEQLGETAELSYEVQLAPEGIYDYSVKTVYSDEFVSVPTSIVVEKGDAVVYDLPFTENFDGDMKPGNWQVSKLLEMKDNYMWRFDNWFELTVENDLFEGNFASINSLNAGYTTVSSLLVTPLVRRNTTDSESRTMLEFDMDYKGEGSTVAMIGYTTDIEQEPTEIRKLTPYLEQDLQAGQVSAPVHMSIDVTNCFKNNDALMFVWKYNGFMSNYMAIDNINIFNTTSGIENTFKQTPVQIVAANGAVNVKAAAINAVQIVKADGTSIASVDCDNKNEVSIDGLQPGIYIVKVVADNQTTTNKITLK